MTICEPALAAALGDAWPGVEVKEIRPLLGGQWATMAHVRLGGTPPGVPDDLVIRVVPDPAMGAKELAVQTAASEAGVLTPRVHLTGAPGGPLGGAWAVMDLAPGAPMLTGLDGATAIRRLPVLLRRLPRQLADTMTAIHRVDPGPIAHRVRDGAPTAALTVDELWAQLRGGATDLPSLSDALDRLHETRPPDRRVVLCHGDLHPLNLLADDEGRISVLDWTAATIASPAYDVAFTWLLLGNPPLEAPPALRPAIAGGGALLARRFLREYRRSNPGAALTDLPWYAALHATRILLDLTSWQRSNDPRARTHPWRLVAPGALRALRHATGVEVAL